MKSTLIFTLILVLIVFPGHASLIVPSQLEEVAGQIDTVLKVRVKEVIQTEKHMTLKNRQEGPIVGFEKNIKVEVLSELVGHVDSKEIAVKYYMAVLNKYDEDGNVKFSYSLQIPGIALEYEITEDQEYIFCFGPVSPNSWKEGTVNLMRAEKPEMELAVVKAVTEAKKSKK